MKVSTSQLVVLKQYGFMWVKDGSTDRVEAECIKDVVPAANGFTVIYNTKATALEMSTAEVEDIELPNNFETEWIRVKWNNIVDQRRRAA